VTTENVRIRTFDDQSPAIGWRLHPGTWGVGVDVLHDSCYHITDVDTQLSKFVVAWRPLPAKLIRDLCRPSPVPWGTVSGERVAHHADEADCASA